MNQPAIITRARSGQLTGLNRRRQHGPTAGQFALVCFGISVGCALLAYAIKK